MFIWFEELFMCSVFILLEFWHLNHLSRQEFDGSFELLCPQCLNLLEDQKYLMIKRKEKGKECTFQALYMSTPHQEDQGKQQNNFELQQNRLKYYHLKGASSVALQQRIHPAMQETQEARVLSLSCKGPLEEGMATHSSILAWRIPWTVEPGELQSMGS